VKSQPAPRGGAGAAEEAAIRVCRERGSTRRRQTAVCRARALLRKGNARRRERRIRGRGVGAEGWPAGLA
jgi:hypothetical protein